MNYIFEDNNVWTEKSNRMVQSVCLCMPDIKCLLGLKIGIPGVGARPIAGAHEIVRKYICR